MAKYLGNRPTAVPLTSADIQDGVITAADLGANSVDSSELVDGSIDTSHLGATQVTGAKLNTDVISAQTALAVAPADTDEFMVSDAGVLKRIDYSLIKGGGITVADDWKVTASFTGDANPISANLSQTNHAAQGQMGSAMTVSSGVWTFPSTGFWLVTARASSTIDIADGANTYDMIYIGVSTNAGVSWSNCAHAGQGVFNTVAANNTRSGWVVSTILDVTNTTNNLVRFQFDTLNDDREIYAPGGSETDTGFTFIRLGDT